MLDVKAMFGDKEEQPFFVSVGLNHKGGMDKDNFFEYIQNLIIWLYPNATPVKGQWVCIKWDSGPGRLNMELLAYLQFHGFLLFPGVSNTKAVTQETDQSCGPFQSKLQSNLKVILDERLHAEKPTTLVPWIVGIFVFGGKDPKTKCVVGSAFQDGFSHEQNLNAWAKVGTVCSSSGLVSSTPRFGAQLETETTTNRLWLVSSKSISSLPAPHRLTRATTATL
jgi:hypothetical protein